MTSPSSVSPQNHQEDNSSSHALVYGVSFGVAALFFIFFLVCDPRVRGCCRAKLIGTGAKNDNNHDDHSSSSSSPARSSPLPSLSELDRKYHSHLRHSIVEVPKATKPRTAASPLLLSTSSVRKSFKNARNKNLKMRQQQQQQQQQQHAPAEPDFHQHERRQQSHHAFMMNSNAPTANSVVVPTTTASQKNAIVPLDDTASENTNTQFVMVPSRVPFGGL